MSRTIDPQAPPASRGSWQLALALAGISTLLKLLIILCPGPHLSERWVLAEELHKGNIAQEVLDGPLLPLFDYHHAPNGGGTMVVGVLTVPFFVLMGPTIVAVRLVPILFNAVTVFFLTMILGRFVSRRAALAGGLVMAIAVPGYALISVSSEGTHLENNAATMVCLYLYLCLRADSGSGANAASSSPRQLAFAALLGLIAGFAMYFGYMIAIAFSAMLVFEVLHDKLFFLRRWFLCAAAGFLIGFLPWILFNASHAWAGLSLYNLPASNRAGPARIAAKAWANVSSLFASYLPASFFFEGFPIVPRHVVDWIWYVVLMGFTGWAAWSLRPAMARGARALFTRSATTPPLDVRLVFLAYVPIFVVYYGLVDVFQAWMHVDIAHDGRYTTPLFPFLVLGAAVGFDMARPTYERWAARAVALLCALAFVGTLAACDFRRFGESLHEPGASQRELARFIMWKYSADVPRLDRILTRLEERGSGELIDQVVFWTSQSLKWKMQRLEQVHPGAEASRERVATALHFLHERAPEPYKMYCEDPWPGEKQYAYEQRDEWRAEYSLHHKVLGDFERDGR